MALYPALYEKFAALQEDTLAGARLVYPAASARSVVFAVDDIADCLVRVPAGRTEDNSLLSGPFVLPDDGFGRYASSRLILASTCLLGAKAPIAWHHREALQKWIAGKQDPLRAGYVTSVILDELARRRVRKIMGE